MSRNMLNSIPASLDPHGPASSTSSESAPLDYISFHIMVLLYFGIIIDLFGRHLSGESVTGHFLSFSAVAPSDVGGFSGERSAKFFPQYIWQFQCDFFRDKCAVDSYLNLDWLSLVFFNR